MSRRSVLEGNLTVSKPIAPPVESETKARQGLGDDHPLNDIMGTYEGPVWEQILKNIKRNRRRVDRIEAEASE